MIVVVGIAIVIIVIVGLLTSQSLLTLLGMLLHVLGEIGLLSIGFAAKLANVGFEVFGLFVFGDVVQK